MTSRKRSTALAARLNALEAKSQAVRFREMFAAMPAAEFAKCFSDVILAATDAQMAALSAQKAAVDRIGLITRIERVIVDPARPEAA